MRLAVIICGFALVTCIHVGTLRAETADSEVKIIPLKGIWAYQMPGTRDVRELEPDHYGDSLKGLSSTEQVQKQKDSLTYQIDAAAELAKLGKPAAPGFVVSGIGAEALREAHAVLVKGQKPRESFPANSKLSIVFFSRAFEYYVHLDKVERRTSTITIRYFFVPHHTQVMTAHFALIPLGEVPPGEWKVETVRSPIPPSPKLAGMAPPPAAADSITICRPFSFVVELEGAESE